MPTTTETIKTYLENAPINFAKDLTSLYSADMEVQVLVKPLGEPATNDEGNPIPGVREYSSPKYGTFTHHSIRIPKDAGGDPYYNDPTLRFPLDEVVNSIGMTGWDWKNKVSRWVGFDFDSIVGHAAGVGVEDSELERIRAACEDVSWIQVRRSTGGGGLHLYVFFNESDLPKTENHHQHAAAARAVLGLMEKELGFDLTSSVDVCGSVMWVHATRITEVSRGLEVLSPAVDAFPGLPLNWLDNEAVIRGTSGKVQVRGLSGSDQDAFTQLTNSQSKVKPDATHLLIEDRIAELGYTIVWQPDFGCWQSHTAALRDIMLKYPGDYRGVFETLSDGIDQSKANVFMYPMRDGGLRLTRFGRGTNEHASWKQDGKDWTTTTFNVNPDLRAVAAVTNGIEDPDGKGYVMDVAQAAKACEMLGTNLDLDADWLQDFGTKDRSVNLKANKQGSLVVEIQKKNGDVAPAGFIAKPGKFVKKFNVDTENEEQGTSVEQFDAMLRSLVSPDHSHVGWVNKDQNSLEWIGHGRTNVRHILQAMDVEDPDVLIGKLLMQSWRLVNVPFAPEYPAPRQWNRDAAQFAVTPTDPHNHPTWDLVLEHLGKELNEPVKADKWCDQNGITTGAEYLKLWIACLFRFPYDPVPYIFLYGPQNSGKSTLHEALTILVKGGRGITMADEALKSAGNFNGELANAILCVVEETDLSKYGQAYNRIKAWVTGQEILIHRKGQEPYNQANTTHWVHCANHQHECPIFPGDTRITMVYVQNLGQGGGAEVPKDLLMRRLKDEAASFLGTIKGMSIPAPPGRLRLPVIVTESKKEAMQSAQSALVEFIDRACFKTAGELTLFTDFYDAMTKWMGPEQVAVWTKSRVRTEMKEQGLLPYGRGTGNKVFVGNVSLRAPKANRDPQPLWVQDGPKLKQMEG